MEYILREAVITYRNYKKIRAVQVKSPKDVFSWFKEELGADLRERFIVVYLDGRNDVIAFTQIPGGLTASSPDLRIIFKDACLLGSPAILVLHNHPSGIVEPSPEDRKFTNQLKEASKLLDIKVLDHIIVGSDSFYSFADAGTF